MEKERTLSFIRNEIKKVEELIFFSLKIAIQDIEYLINVDDKFIDNLLKYHYMKRRYTFYLWNYIVIQTNKLFDPAGGYQILKILNILINNYSNSEWKELIAIEEIDKLQIKINDDKIQKTIKNNKTIRDKFYAHLDKDSVDRNFREISISLSDIKYLISEVNGVMERLHLLAFNSTMAFNSTNEELGNTFWVELAKYEALKRGGHLYHLFKNEDINS